MAVHNGQRHGCAAESVWPGRRLAEHERIAVRVERVVVDGRGGCAIRASRNGNVMALRHRSAIQHDLEKYAAPPRPSTWRGTIQRPVQPRH